MAALENAMLANAPASVTPEPVLEEDELPRPRDITAVFQGGIFLLLLLAACYAAAEIVLPIVLAFVLMLVLQPAMRVLERWYVPRGVAALALILMLFGAFAGLATVLSGPAATWAQKLPDGIPKLQERLSFLSEPLADVGRSGRDPCHSNAGGHEDHLRPHPVARGFRAFHRRMTRSPAARRHIDVLRCLRRL